MARRSNKAIAGILTPPIPTSRKDKEEQEELEQENYFSN